MNTERIKNYFAVPFDSELGKKLTDYHNRAEQCEKATADWCRSLHERYRFPQLSSGTEIVPPDDSEAGGIWAIIVPESMLTPDNTPDPTLWAYITKKGCRYYFPIVTPVRHYLRYKKAADLLALHDSRWQIDVYIKDPTQPFMYYYDQVRRIMPKADLEAITRELGKEPSPRTRIAVGTRFEIPERTDASTVSLTDEQMERAIVLYREMYQQLPIISANTLVRLTGFSLADIANMHRGDVKARAYLDSYIDKDNRRYLFRTGMTSNHPDIESVIGVEQYFDK